MLSPEKISERQEAILWSIVQEHVDTAAPVSSKTVAERIGQKLSPATIRNEMAHLESVGYLAQPHTSAGRTPSRKGYCYFIQNFLEEATLDSAERRRIRHQFFQVSEELDEYMKLAASILANTVQSASLVGAPTVRRSRIRQVELVSVRDQVVLLIVVLQGGIVKQRLLTVDEPMSQDELKKMSNRLNDLLAGAGLVDIPVQVAHRSTLEPLILESVLDIMRRIDEKAHLEIYRDGLANILHEPEFRESGRARSIAEAFEETSLWDAVFSQVPVSEGVHIIIGGEGRWDQISQCSIVLSSYGSHGGALGTLGVLGPIRMSYPRAVSVVRYVATLMGDVVSGHISRAR
jgi:heat-inducible transcriptional repressor